MAGTSTVCSDEKEQQLDLFVCPRQPGFLRISRHACALRHALAQRLAKEEPKDAWSMRFKAGLEICRHCPEGKVFSKRLKRTRQVSSAVQGRSSVAGSGGKRAYIAKERF